MVAFVIDVDLIKNLHIHHILPIKRNFNRIEDTIVKNPLIIVECKALGNKGDGIEQLKGYLCARDTPFGILAVGPKQGNWKYHKNHGGYKFETLSPRKTFETHVTDRVNSEATVAGKIEERVNQAIEKQKNKLQADFQKRVTDLEGNQQKLLNEARKDSFKNGFWGGAISIVVLVIVVAIAASCG